jgi:hypothetical protein
MQEKGGDPKPDSGEAKEREAGNPWKMWEMRDYGI